MQNIQPPPPTTCSNIKYIHTNTKSNYTSLYQTFKYYSFCFGKCPECGKGIFKTGVLVEPKLEKEDLFRKRKRNEFENN